MSKKQSQLPRNLQKLFIVGVVAFYGMVFFDTVVQTMRSGDGWQSYFWNQVLFVAAPLFFALIVYATRKNRSIDLETIFQVLVATFGIVLLFGAIMAMGNYISAEITSRMVLGNGDVQAASNILNLINTGTMLVAFTGAISFFVLSIWSARKRGDW